MDEIIKHVTRLIENGEEFVLAKILSRCGSTPRTAGTKMIITKDGTTYGTIGGGLMEATVIEKSFESLSNGVSRLIPFDLSQNDMAGMDLICGGEAEVLIDRISPTYENADAFNRWQQALNRGEECFFLTIILGEAGKIERTVHCLLLEDGSTYGAFPLTSFELEEIYKNASKNSQIKVVTFDNALVLVEPSEKQKEVLIFGAGHVAQPTAYLASLVDFRVSVFDDRQEFANADRFPTAGKIHLLENFENSFSDLKVDEDSFIIIVTRGHLYDKTVLANALKTNAGYIGMIGSRKKRNAIYNFLLDQGFTTSDLDRVHCPIGISIGAETPEEIAMSIVAELIRQRAGK